DIKNSPEVNAFWNNYNNTDIQRKRKLWQIEPSDLDYIYKRDQQLEKEIKLIRDERIKTQYSELNQSQFAETNASIMNLSSILNDPIESYSTIAPKNDGYLDNHFSINVNKQCVIMKADNVDTFPKEIRSWLIDVLLSEKNLFESAIMTSPNPDHPFRKFSMTTEGPLIRYIGERKYTVERIVPLFKAIQSVYREYTFDRIEVQANCIKDAKMLFPEFDLKLNKVDGICFKVSSNKEVVFIEVSGGPENAILKHIKMQKAQGIFVPTWCSALFTIGDRITLSELRLDRRHYYKISQIKSAILPFSFEEVEKFIEVFELLYALVNGLKNQTSELEKLMLADFNSNEPTIRNWIWVSDTLSTWEDTEIIYEDFNYE
ncbi:20112_t:CDS:2, partial [Gigaspora rosea]